jgi:predicted DNA-binding protein
MPRPPTGPTPIRHIRIKDKLWTDLQLRAERESRPVAAVIRDAVERYLRMQERQGEQ